MMEPTPWTASQGRLVFAMWTVMMIAMMLPSATPMLLLFARASRMRTAEQAPFPPTVVFLAGYAVVWTVFSAVMTVLQWRLDRAMILSPALTTTSHVVAGLFLIITAAYQWLPAKTVCLTHCRSPMDFLVAHWRSGVLGAFRMGLVHGGYCLGCCWGLMLLLFVGGVMNLLWVAAIALFVLVEKAAPFGRIISRAGSMPLAVWGVATLLGR
jgi:predicted metal-binding membrane protein